jgi:hypothetical protein
VRNSPRTANTVFVREKPAGLMEGADKDAVGLRNKALHDRFPLLRWAWERR